MSLDIYLSYDTEEDYLYSANVTHNLGKMAVKAGIYKCLWRAPENQFLFAHQLIMPLRLGISRLQEDTLYYSTLNPANGWGTLTGFIDWLIDLVEKCNEFPNAKITTRR